MHIQFPSREKISVKKQKGCGWGVAWPSILEAPEARGRIFSHLLSLCFGHWAISPVLSRSIEKKIHLESLETDFTPRVLMEKKA